MKTNMRILAALLCLVLMLTLLPAVSAEDTPGALELDLANGSLTIATTGYLFSGGSFIKYTGDYIIRYTGGGTNWLRLNNKLNCRITLDQVNMTATGTSCIRVEGGPDVTLVLRGENRAAYSDTSRVGTAISVTADSRLTIEAETETDSLEAVGGAYGAGIGSPADAGTVGSQIVINGGVIRATSGNEAAGIGGARKSGAQVTVNGGNVTATSLRNGAGIGAGREAPDGSTVTVGGGVIHAVSRSNGNGIGGGFRSACSVLSVTKGIVSATAGHKAIRGIGAGVDYVIGEEHPVSLLIGEQASVRSTTVGSAVPDVLNGRSATAVTLPQAGGITVDGKFLTLEGSHADGEPDTYYFYYAPDSIHLASQGDKSAVLYAGKTVGSDAWKTASPDLVYVGYQQASEDSGKIGIRFITALKNSGVYESIGYVITVSGDAEAGFTGTATTIYGSMRGTDKAGHGFIAVRAEDYASDGLFGAVLRGVPATGNYTVSVLATATGTDGIVVCTDVYTYTVSGGVIAQN